MSLLPATDGSPGPLPSRRAVLRGAAVSAIALVVAGCTTTGDPRDAVTSSPTTSGPSTSGPSTSGPDDDIDLVTRAIAHEEALLRFATTAGHRYPRQRSLLSGVAAIQARHVARLRASLTDLDPPVTRVGPPVPPQAADLVPTLVRLEGRARDERLADSLASTSGLLAELFGSVAASHAATVSFLDPTTTADPVVAPRQVDNVSVLASCVAAEHAAVYGYALLGGVLRAFVSQGPLAAAARTSYEVHRDRRDALVGMFAASQQTPPVSEAAYAAPFPVLGPVSARRLARYLEGRCATVYAQAIAATTGDAREFVGATLLDCATRGVGWGAAPSAFPGLTSA